MLSHLAQKLRPSPTLVINDRAAELKAQGESVIHLGGGEPKSRAPMSALQSAAQMLSTGEVRYTPASGSPAMKDAVIRYTKDFYRYEVKRSNVIVSNGAKQSIYTALLAICNPGDEVIFPAPYWVSYPDMVELCGGVSRVVMPQVGYIPTLSEFEAQITEKTKVILLNSPNNPTGLTYPEELLRGLVELCEKRNLWLILDDIYHRLIFDGRMRLSGYDYVTKHGDDSKLVVINGISKQYAMTGFRIGWAVGQAPLIKAMANIQSHQTSGPSSLSQQAAVAAILGEQSSVDCLCETLQNQRDVLVSRLRSIPGIKVENPHGTFYTFVDCRAYDNDSTRLAQYLLNSVRVATVPGVAFGMEGHLRISFCSSLKEIIEGVERISFALDPNGPSERLCGLKRITRSDLEALKAGR